LISHHFPWCRWSIFLFDYGQHHRHSASSAFGITVHQTEFILLIFQPVLSQQKMLEHSELFRDFV
jgi:hypothetical protein